MSEEERPPPQPNADPPALEAPAGLTSGAAGGLPATTGSAGGLAAFAAGSPDLAPESWDLDLAAAGLRIDADDTEAMFGELADKLARILGRRVQLTREGGLRRSKRVMRIVVDTAAGRLEARRDRTGPHFLAVHAVRGITLQTNEISADEWLDQLMGAVREEAARSNDVRAALGRLLQ